MICITLVVVLYISACGTTSQPIPTPVPPTLASQPSPTPATPLAPSPTATTLPPTLTPIPTIKLHPYRPLPHPPKTQTQPPGVILQWPTTSESKRVILYGGQTGRYTLASSYNGSTWVYDAAANQVDLIWNHLPGPSTRVAAELIYDSQSDRVILFGGGHINLMVQADTWVYNYNTNTWKEMAKGPSSHLGARLAYDTQSDRVILFGGYSLDKNNFYNDTWAYDFNTDTWTNMKPVTSPPGRNYQAMTYDTQADRVLVWGGMDVSGTKPVDESIWSYDFNTNTWLEINPVRAPIPPDAITPRWFITPNRTGPSCMVVFPAAMRPGPMLTKPIPGRSWHPARLPAFCHGIAWYTTAPRIKSFFLEVRLVPPIQLHK